MGPARLSRQFPELKQLTAAIQLQRGYERLTLDLPPVQSFANLRRLAVTNMIYPYGGDASTHLSSGNATTIVSSLLAACPRLEDTSSVTHGVMYRSSVEVADRVGLPPFPARR